MKPTSRLLILCLLIVLPNLFISCGANRLSEKQVEEAKQEARKFAGRYKVMAIRTANVSEYSYEVDIILQPASGLERKSITFRSGSCLNRIVKGWKLAEQDEFYFEFRDKPSDPACPGRPYPFLNYLDVNLVKLPS
ncbi:hypothetical protein IPM19_01175 [bacterium]|nr:MAG: hypothetical protein IPM19_01175 [bacterium]